MSISNKTTLFRPVLYYSGGSIKFSKVFKDKEKANAWVRRRILNSWEDFYSNYVCHPDDFDIGFEELEVGD